MSHISSPLRRQYSRLNSQGTSGEGLSSSNGVSSRLEVDSTSDSDSLSSPSSAPSESSSEESSEEEGRVKEVKAYKADLTPHHRSEKRPQRRTAARASDAWSELGPKSNRKKILEVVIDVHSREKRTPKKETTTTRPEAEVLIVSPAKRSQRETQVITPKKKDVTETVRVEEDTPTPAKKQKLLTPRRDQHQTETPTSTAKRRIVKHKEFRPLLEQDDPTERNLVRPTSSDAYFANHASRSQRKSSKHQTSDNVISGTMPLISPKAVAQLSSYVTQKLGGSSSNLSTVTHFESYYDQWWSLLACLNRPLLMYGVGSKKVHLQGFARYLARKGRCASVVIRGEAGGRIEDALREMERYLHLSPSISLDERRVVSTSLEARAHALVKAMHQENHSEDNSPPGFLILIHNFDYSTFLQEKSLNVLEILTASARIHLVADTCHVNSGLISRLHSESDQGSLPWLWVNMTTYVPMLEEIINERGVGVSKAIGLPRVLDIRAAGGGGASDVFLYNEDYLDEQDDSAALAGHGSATAAPPPPHQHLLSERAAIHILRSVTVKAKRLFLLLGDILLSESTSSHSEAKGTRATIITYNDLTTLARKNFLAMAPDGLRSLLVEFTTHGLIRVEGQSQQQLQSGESHDQSQGLLPVNHGARVTIALGKTDLSRVIDEIKAQI
ncbi:hypothetical protein CBS101457_006089 [Exobasidium rhododendri]|nr:hypothetical protein CBS101457_006089 [Exobasidium rhododendri]